MVFSALTPPSGEAISWPDGIYSILRHGVTLTSCDSEPVQTPGCIQAHGVLLVVRPSDLAILQVSESSTTILGLAPEELLGRPLGVALGGEHEGTVRRFLDQAGPDGNPLYVVTLPARGEVQALDVTVHTVEGIAIIELEATDRATGVEPDYYGLIKKSVVRLQGARSLAELSRILTDEVRALTGFDRVMVYRFHADGHGEVFAESRAEAYAPWLGLHYPAEDIPLPAREVFKQTWCRPVPDVEGALAELVPLARPDTGQPLKMTHCALRGPSIMYTEYLQNMGVSAALTMSLRRNGELWGLIACHHYAGPKPVAYAMRAACEFVAQTASIQLLAAEEREHILYRLRIESVHNELVAAAAQEGGFATIMDGKTGLLEALQAGGAALLRGDRWWKVGATPTDRELGDLANWLALRPELLASAQHVYATDSLARDYPAAASFAGHASGLLAFAFARGRGNLMMWFRPETIQVVDWAGDPDDKPTIVGPNGPRLTPRASFELFRESVHQRSLPWLSVEVDAAARLRVLLIDVVVGRAEHLAELNAELSRSNEELDAFAYAASHDLKEPLRGISTYAHELLEHAAAADGEQRRKLEGLIRLTVRMDGLLDSLLHFARVGRIALVLEVADLDEVVGEALEVVGSRLARPQVQVSIPRPLPHLRCDRIRVREIFVNLISNALKYGDKEVRRIDVGFVAAGEDLPRPGAKPEAAGQTIFFVRDNGIGIALQHFGQVFEMFRRLHGRGEFGGGSGVGLTIVQKLVERHHGRIWIDSTVGVGSTFWFTLPGTPEGDEPS